MPHFTAPCLNERNHKNILATNYNDNLNDNCHQWCYWHKDNTVDVIITGVESNCTKINYDAMNVVNYERVMQSVTWLDTMATLMTHLADEIEQVENSNEDHRHPTTDATADNL